MSRDVLALCGTPTDIAVFGDRGTTLVALTAAAAAEAERRSLEYRELSWPPGAGDVATARRRLGVSVNGWIAAADDLIHVERPQTPAHFRPAAGSHLVLWSLLSEVHIAAAALSALIESVQPSALAARRPVGGVIPHDLAIRAPAPLLIAGDLATRYGIDAQLEDGDVVPPRAVGERSSLRASARRLLSAAIGQATRAAGTRDGAVLVVGGGYDLGPVVSELAGRKVPVTLVRSNLRFGVTGDDWRPAGTGTNETLVGRLDELGVADLQFMHELLDAWWKNYVPALWDAFVETRATLGRRRYAAVVAAEAGGGTAGSAALQAAAGFGVRRFVYQHGSTFVLDATLWEGWLDNADELLVYGEGTEARLRETWRDDIPVTTKLTPVGSARLDRPRAIRRERDGVRRILYVPALFGTYGRLVGDLSAYPDVSYYRLQRDVLALFAGRDDVQLIYKAATATNAHPNPILAFLQEHVPTARVVDAPSPARLAYEVDAVVVDHPVTALGEVLVTSAPTVVYAPRELQESRETETALNLLRRRAFVATVADEFIAAVRCLLDCDSSVGDERDRSFVRRYVTHRDDNFAAARAADAIFGRRAE